MTPAEINAALGEANVSVGIAIAGGGLTGISELLAAGGASAWLYEVRVPYSQSAFDAVWPNSHLRGPYVGNSAATHLAYGMRIALHSKAKGVAPVAIGVTAKLTTGVGEREGREHIVHACVSHSGRPDRDATLHPTGTTRAEQERETADFIQRLLIEITQATDADHKTMERP